MDFVPSITTSNVVWWDKNLRTTRHEGALSEEGYGLHLLLSQWVLYRSKIIDEILIETILDGRKTEEEAISTTFGIFQNIQRKKYQSRGNSKKCLLIGDPFFPQEYQEARPSSSIAHMVGRLFSPYPINSTYPRPAGLPPGPRTRTAPSQ